MDLTLATTDELLEELRSRTHCLNVAMLLKASGKRHPDIRVVSHAEPKHELELLGIVSMAVADCREGCQRALSLQSLENLGDAEASDEA